MHRQQISAAQFPDAPGAYVVFADASDHEPLYVGRAARQTLRQRWSRQHLRNRSGGSALRRSLGVHLGLVEQKIVKPERYYPSPVEEEITHRLRSYFVELHETATGEEAHELERRLIAELNPTLNVQK
jgi:excinuclease UvrABC nuclease subunit